MNRFDFDNAEDYGDYMAKREAMPKAAFQYGQKNRGEFSLSFEKCLVKFKPDSKGRRCGRIAPFQAQIYLRPPLRILMNLS